MGRGHWDACVGTWDLGTRVEGRGNVGTWGRGDAGTREVKSEVNAISLSS